jgi:hypothetical protein
VSLPFPPARPRFFRKREILVDGLEIRAARQDGVVGFHIKLEDKSFFLPRAKARVFARLVLFGDKENES